MSRATNSLLTVTVAVLLAAFVYSAYLGHRLAVSAAPQIPLVVNVRLLPYYAFRSLVRMTAAYGLSLAFSLAYGYKAAVDPRAEKVLIPVLDVLQSVPILGFFPAAVYLLISLFHGSAAAVEMASVFLIFTSQAWNMTFGFYEAVKTLPRPLLEACSAYGIDGYLRFKRLYLPAGVPKLVYNSILSWAGGWYFLIAAEIIALGPMKYSLPGLGSYLMRAAEQGALLATVAGVSALVVVIVTMNIFLWRPLTYWSEKFKYQFVGSMPPPRGLGYRLWWQAPFFSWLREKVVGLTGRLVAVLEAYGARLSLKKTQPWRRALAWILGFFLLYLLARACWHLVLLLLPPWQPGVAAIPWAVLRSFFRICLAYSLSLAWTIPAAVWLGRNERVYGVLMPFFEVLASVPATALFPVIIFLVVRLTGGIEIASILLLLTGMQWYLLFNLLAGVKGIPADLKELAGAYGVRGFLYWRRIVLPAMVPSLITGSITAWGGGWNALVVAEYTVYGGRVLAVPGIGSLLDRATYGAGNLQVIWFSLAAMVAVITFLNHFFWRRLYNLAVKRYSIEG